MPTCSIPIAVQLRPTVWRQIVSSGTSWIDRPVAVDHEVRARAGQLVELGVGYVVAANVFHADENVVVAV